MAKRDPRMIPLGYGKFVRADRVYALVPIEGSERAILADVETALAEAAGLPRRRRVAVTGQESLLP